MLFVTNPVNIIISCNCMSSFHYKHVLLIIYDPGNIKKMNIHELLQRIPLKYKCFQFSDWGWLIGVST